MALAYSPGLKVKELTVVRKTRLLPLPGQILVKEGDGVSWNTRVATTKVPGEVQTIPAAATLTVEPEDLKMYMKKKEGDRVEKQEIICIRSSFFGLSKALCTSPIAGTIDLISETSGQITIKGDSVDIYLDAYIPGKVVKVIPEQGVEIETVAGYVQGIFGIGGEAHGQITVVSESPADVLSAERITADAKGKVVIAGSSVTIEALNKAVEVGVSGIIVGGIDGKALRQFLGYEIGVAITGQEQKGLTLIATEGFGKMPMSNGTYSLMKSFEGMEAALNGATQIRAGVLRPEVIVPKSQASMTQPHSHDRDVNMQKGMEPGMQVRIIRKPHFGAIGTVASLPIDLKRIASESEVRVMEVNLADGRIVTVPRANVEIIEE